MTERFAIYYRPAPRRLGRCWRARAEAWLGRSPESRTALTVSARRYGFHATIKAPMALAAGRTRAELEAALAAFARDAAAGADRPACAAAARRLPGAGARAAAAGAHRFRRPTW